MQKRRQTGHTNAKKYLFGLWKLGITFYGKKRSNRRGRGRLEVVDMIRSKELMGINVVSRMSGRRLGKVCGVDYRPGEKWIRGLIVETGGLRRSRRYLRRADITLLGTHVVMTDGPLRVLPAQANCPSAVYTPDGQLWGRISALQIDPATAQVGQAEVQVSLFEDLAHGCRVVQASTDLAIRDDRVMYHPPENSG